MAQVINNISITGKRRLYLSVNVREGNNNTTDADKIVHFAGKGDKIYCQSWNRHGRGKFYHSKRKHTGPYPDGKPNLHFTPGGRWLIYLNPGLILNCERLPPMTKDYLNFILSAFRSFRLSDFYRLLLDLFLKQLPHRLQLADVCKSVFGHQEKGTGIKI